MHSKISLWDLYEKLPLDLKNNNGSIHLALTMHDPFCQRIIKDQVQTSLLAQNRKMTLGQDVDLDFIENTFSNFGFFAFSETYFILQADQIPTKWQSLFLDSISKSPDLSIVLFFDKTPKIFIDYFKKSGLLYEVEPVKNWEAVKLFQLMSRYFKLSFTPEAQRFFIDYVEMSPDIYYQSFQLLKNDSYDSHKIEMQQIQELLVKSQFDFFKLIELYHHDPKSFFISLLSQSKNEEWLIGFSYFFTTHLLKILFPKAMVEQHASKYEQSIERWRAQAKIEVLKRDIQLMSDIEFFAKNKSLELERVLRDAFLKA